jgi:hypothetical protein
MADPARAAARAAPAAPGEVAWAPEWAKGTATDRAVVGPARAATAAPAARPAPGVAVAPAVRVAPAGRPAYRLESAPESSRQRPGTFRARRGPVAPRPPRRPVSAGWRRVRTRGPAPGWTPAVTVRASAARAVAARSDGRRHPTASPSRCVSVPACVSAVRHPGPTQRAGPRPKVPLTRDRCDRWWARAVSHPVRPWAVRRSGRWPDRRSPGRPGLRRPRRDPALRCPRAPRRSHGRPCVPPTTTPRRGAPSTETATLTVPYSRT